MHLAHYLGLLHRAETELARAYREVADHHADEADVAQTCRRLAGQCDQHAGKLAPFARRYSEQAASEPERLHSELFGGTRTGGLGLLRDLHDLTQTAAQLRWLRTRTKQAAPQALVVAG